MTSLPYSGFNKTTAVNTENVNKQSEHTQSSSKIVDCKGENLCKTKLFLVSSNSHIIVDNRTICQEILLSWISEQRCLVEFLW